MIEKTRAAEVDLTDFTHIQIVLNHPLKITEPACIRVRKYVIIHGMPIEVCKYFVA